MMEQFALGTYVTTAIWGVAVVLAGGYSVSMAADSEIPSLGFGYWMVATVMAMSGLAEALGYFGPRALQATAPILVVAAGAAFQIAQLRGNDD